MSVQLYKNGTALAMQTDCQTEELFIEQFCALLTKLIDGQAHAGAWEYHLRQWLPQYVEVCNAYRGYKTRVVSKTVYVAGEVSPGDPLHSVDDLPSEHAAEGGMLTNGSASHV